MAIPGNFLSPTTETVDPDTSGWTTILNCTKTLGTGGRAGAGTLLLTSAASGEMQARTATGYPVIVGQTYETFADASSTTQAERIGIQWLNSSGTVLSTTWSLTTSAASVTWHRVSVAGPAPTGTATARVVLSATPTAAARTHSFENVYLGTPLRTAGNLLGFDTESFEIDTSGWGVEANCALSRTVPILSWPIDFYTAGGQVLALTASGSGNMSALCVDRPSVTPGVDYRADCYLNPPTLSAQTWIELRFYNASGTQLSATRATLAPVTTGYMRQRVSAPAPASAATCAVAVGMASATSGQVIHVETVVVIDATNVLAEGNVIPYADASFEQGVGSWTRTSGSATLTRSTPWGAQAFDDSYSLTVSSTSASNNVLASAQYPISAGPWRAETHFKVTSGAWSAGVGIHWYDTGGTSLGTSTLSPAPIPNDGHWWFFLVDAPAPTGAATARVEVTANAGTSSSVLQVDAAELAPHSSGFSLNFDSSLGRITLILRDLPVGDMIRLYRVVNGTQTLVRGPAGWVDGQVIDTDQMIVEDYEAPIGAVVSYRVEFYGADGSSDGFRDSPTGRLSLPDPSDCWIKDPLQPERNILLRASVAPDWTRPIELTEYRVRGRRNSVILSDVRGGLTGTVLVWTTTDAERTALHFALDSGDPLLLQFMPGLGLDDAYYSIGEASEPRFSPVGSEPRRQWSLPLIQVDAPIGGVGGTAGWTVQDLLSTWDTSLDVANGYNTVLDVALDNRGT
jgi:hypothetical protein